MGKPYGVIEQIPFEQTEEYVIENLPKYFQDMYERLKTIVLYDGNYPDLTTLKIIWKPFEEWAGPFNCTVEGDKYRGTIALRIEAKDKHTNE